MDRAPAVAGERAGDPAAWRAVLSGLCTSLVGIGLARFAYTPLIPALIAAGWFAPSQAAYLGAANLAGYLAGALFGRRLPALASPAWVLRGLMLAATASFFACALPLSFAWYFLWRFAAGLSGGALMVLAAPLVLPQVPAARRGLAGGLIFTGVGLGIVASGTLVPLLLGFGLVATWCGLGALALLLTLLAWGGWPHRPTAPLATADTAPAKRPRRPAALTALYLEYGLAAFALVPHMVFLVDFVARDLGQGLDMGARYWVLFGLGALAGPVLAGWLGDRIGFGRALRLCFLVQILAIGLPAVFAGAPSLALSSFAVGAFVPGIVPLVFSRVQEIVPGDARGQGAAWSIATTAFALGQAAGAYGLSVLFARGDVGYALLFAVGAGSLALALAIDLCAARTNRSIPR